MTTYDVTIGGGSMVSPNVTYYPYGGGGNYTSYTPVVTYSKCPSCGYCSCCGRDDGQGQGNGHSGYLYGKCGNCGYCSCCGRGNLREVSAGAS